MSLVTDGFPSFPGILVVPLANSIPPRRAEKHTEQQPPWAFQNQRTPIESPKAHSTPLGLHGAGYLVPEINLNLHGRL